MAQIKEYTSERALEGVKPSEEGIAAEAQAAWRIGRFYNQTGEEERRTAGEFGQMVKQVGQNVIDHVSQDDAAKMTSYSSSVTLNSMDAMTKLIANPDEPNYDAKSKELLGSTQGMLDEMVNGAQTSASKAHAEKLRDAVMDHLNHIRTSDISTRAGNDAVRNLEQTHNNVYQMVQQHPDDASLTLALTMIGEHAKTQFKNLSVEGTGKVQEMVQRQEQELIGASLHARIMQDPNAGMADIPKWEDKLGPEKTQQLQNFGEAWKRRQIEDQEMERRLKKEAETDRGEAKLREYLPHLGNISARTIVSDKDLTPSQAVSLFHANHSFAQEAKEGAAKDTTVPAVDKKLTDGLFLPQDDPNATTLAKVVEAKAKHQLDNERYSFFAGAVTTRSGQTETATKEVSDMRDNAKKELSAAINPKNSIGGFLFGSSAQTSEAKAHTALDAALIDGHRHGKRDIDMLTPGNPDYIMKPEWMKKYVDMAKAGGDDLVNEIQSQGKPSGEKPPLSSFFH